MTERKPTGVSFESWIDKQIREATERGEFENLPGAGKPLPGLNNPYDELWWVKQKVREESLPGDELLPEPLKLRKQIDRLPETVSGLSTEQAVRAAVRELNERILAWLRNPAGPQVALRPVDDDEIVATWRRDREAERPPAPTPSPSPGPARERRRWFRRKD